MVSGRAAARRRHDSLQLGLLLRTKRRLESGRRASLLVAADAARRGTPHDPQCEEKRAYGKVLEVYSHAQLATILHYCCPVLFLVRSRRNSSSYRDKRVHFHSTHTHTTHSHTSQCDHTHTRHTSTTTRHIFIYLIFRRTRAFSSCTSLISISAPGRLPPGARGRCGEVP